MALIDENINDIDTINNVEHHGEVVSVVIKFTNGNNTHCPVSGDHNYKPLIDEWVAAGNTIGTQ